MPERSERRFSREETALILRRATEGERGSPGELESGLSLEEIVAAAREAGIDPVAVRRAAAITPVPGHGLHLRLTGAPVAPAVRARFEGRLPTDARAEFQSAVEDALGRSGEVREEGGGWVWREDHGFGRTTVSARPAGGAVAVSAEADRRGHLLALVLSLATAIALGLQPLGGFGALAALTGPLGAALAPLAALGLGVRALWPALQRPTRRRLEQVTLAIGALLDREEGRDALPADPAASS